MPLAEGGKRYAVGFAGDPEPEGSSAEFLEMGLEEHGERRFRPANGRR